jgi:hypothetical protein
MKPMRKLLYVAVITLVSFAPFARAQTSPNAVSPKPTPVPTPVVRMPEASSTAMLAVDLLAAGALILVIRRRAARRNP